MRALATITVNSNVQSGFIGSNDVAICGLWGAVVIVWGWFCFIFFFLEKTNNDVTAVITM